MKVKMHQKPLSTAMPAAAFSISTDFLFLFNNVSLHSIKSINFIDTNIDQLDIDLYIGM